MLVIWMGWPMSWMRERAETSSSPMFDEMNNVRWLTARARASMVSVRRHRPATFPNAGAAGGTVLEFDELQRDRFASRVRVGQLQRLHRREFLHVHEGDVS